MAASKETPNLLQADTHTLELIADINQNPPSGKSHLSHALREVLDPKEARAEVESVVGGENALVLVVLSCRCAVVDQPFLRNEMQKTGGWFYVTSSSAVN